MRLQIQQRIGEPADLWLLRAFCAALPAMNVSQAKAAAMWMMEHAILKATREANPTFSPDQPPTNGNTA